MWHVSRPDAEHEYANFMKFGSKVKVTEVKLSKINFAYNVWSIVASTLLTSSWVTPYMYGVKPDSAIDTHIFHYCTEKLDTIVDWLIQIKSF